MYLVRLRYPVNDSDHSLGPVGAPVTLVEYGDYECRHCGKAYPLVKRLHRKMGNGMRFVFRNFPMEEQHPRSEDAARAAEAAGLQGRFWEMNHLLFTNQRHLDMESLRGYAAGLRLDIDRFDRDMFGSRVTGKIGSDIETGIRSGVNGTPTFFLNEVRFDRDWGGYGLYEAVREAALAVQAD